MHQTAQGTMDDRELARRVAALLHERCHPLRTVTATSNDGTVTLQGTVGSFYERQLCIEFCRKVDGVVRLVDKIRVAERNGSP